MLHDRVTIIVSSVLGVILIAAMVFLGFKLAKVRGLERGIRGAGGACPWHKMQLLGFVGLVLNGATFYGSVLRQPRMSTHFSLKQECGLGLHYSQGSTWYLRQCSS